MDINFNVDKILQDRLAKSMGLDKYKYIMEQVKCSDVSKNMEFQKSYNGFYIVRKNAEWRKVYYDYFEKIKKETPVFADILTYLYEKTGNIEPSFSSKMLASIYSDKPIWDRYVVQNLNMKLKGTTKEEKLQNAIELYDNIEKWYKDFLLTEKAIECISVFDRRLPDYKDISNIKKIDSILWSIG